MRQSGKPVALGVRDSHAAELAAPEVVADLEEALLTAQLLDQ